MTESSLPAPSPKRRRPLRRFAQILGFGFALAIGLVVAVPYAASSGFVRERVTEGLAEALGAPVAIERLGFSWSGSVEVDGFGLGPAGGSASSSAQPVARWRHAAASCDPWALADGRLDLGLRLEGVVVQLPEVRPEGDSGSTAVVEGPGSGPADGPDLDEVRLDVEIRDARVEVVRVDGSIVEAIDVSVLTVQKPFGAGPLELVLDGKVRGPGAPLHVDLRVDPSFSGAVEGELRCSALDLGLWRPLVEPWLPPGSLDALEGILEADLRIEGHLGDGTMETGGHLAVARPRIAGSLLSGLDFAVPAVRLEPVCTLSRGAGGELTVDSSRVRLDAGVLSAEGRPAPAGRFGLSFSVDLAAVAAMGGPMPPALRGVGNAARGIVELDLAAGDGTVVTWSELDVDFVTLDQGVRELLRDGRGTLRLAPDGRVHVEAAGEIRAAEAASGGTFALVADASSDFASSTATLRLDGWDFEDQRVLLDRLVPGSEVERLDGVVSADLAVARGEDGEITVGGEVLVTDAAVSGPAVLGMDLRGERWSLVPDVGLAVAEDGTLSVRRVVGAGIDLGFLSLRGAPAAPDRLGFEFACDGDRMAAMGAPLPEELAGSGLRVVGTVDVPADLDVATLPALLHADLEVLADRVLAAGQDLAGLRLGVGLREGDVAIELRQGTWNGGPIRLTAEGPLDLEAPPVVRLSLGAEGAAVGPSVLPALEYVLPTFAGLGTSFSNGLPVTFASQLGFSVELEGPAFPTEGEPILAWLDHWVGSGSVGLADGRFTPSAGLKGLLELTGQSGVVTFDEIASRFEIAQGSVRTGLSKLSTKGAEYGFRGETRLDGTLAHRFDARALLERHRDGRKILEYLGDTPVEAMLEGSLTSPRLALPNIADLASAAAGSALEKGAKDLLDKVLGPQKGKGDEAAKGVGDLLRGILGGKKKGGG